MAKYESKVKQIVAPVEQVYGVLSNLENIRPIIESSKDNDNVRAQIEAAGQDPAILDSLKDVRITSDSIAIPAPMVGEISLRICEREENKCIKFETEQSPIAANMWIQVLPSEGIGTKMRLTLKADLNPMIKMMIGSKLEDGIDKFADMLAMLPYSKMLNQGGSC